MMANMVAEIANSPLPDVDSTLDAVGPRLRALRTGRGLTLADLAAATGISVSTLSRLESGARRPALELLLRIARALRIGLDEIVEPTADDPRVRSTPFRKHGSLFLPLTRTAGDLHAYKQVIPARPVAHPPTCTHDGYEWFYVLSGRVRLVLGEQDLVVEQGEAAEFDTRVAHSVTNPGPGPAEIISIFSDAGEKLHVRASTSPRG